MLIHGTLQFPRGWVGQIGLNRELSEQPGCWVGLASRSLRLSCLILECRGVNVNSCKKYRITTVLKTKRLNVGKKSFELLERERGVLMKTRRG